jgi:arylsulfatase A-like enzyme
MPEVETHLVVMSDHGESFGEAGSIGHGKRQTDEQLHVPLLVLSPKARPGRRDAPVGTVDVTATILGLAGLADEKAMGRDLLADAPGEGEVFGMRRTFAKSGDEDRIDGRSYDLPDLAFYRVHGDEIYAGNRRAIRIGDTTPPRGNTPDLESTRSLFAEFERQYRGLASPARLSPEDRARLEALGYGR